MRVSLCDPFRMLYKEKDDPLFNRKKKTRQQYLCFFLGGKNKLREEELALTFVFFFHYI